MQIDSGVFRELVLKQHDFRSELSEADTLYCVVQFAVLAGVGFPVVAGVTHETLPDGKRGMQILVPDFKILSKVTHEDMREVEKRLVLTHGWKTASIERGTFYSAGFHGTSYRIALEHKDKK